METSPSHLLGNLVPKTQHGAETNVSGLALLFELVSGSSGDFPGKGQFARGAAEMPENFADMPGGKSTETLRGKRAFCRFARDKNFTTKTHG